MKRFVAVAAALIATGCGETAVQPSDSAFQATFPTVDVEAVGEWGDINNTVKMYRIENAETGRASLVLNARNGHGQALVKLDEWTAKPVEPEGGGR